MGVPSHPGGAGSPGGDEKQENEHGVSWGLSASPMGENDRGVAIGGDADEEAGGGGRVEKEQVVEVILDAGDALTAKEALLQVGKKSARGAAQQAAVRGGGSQLPI